MLLKGQVSHQLLNVIRLKEKRSYQAVAASLTNVSPTALLLAIPHIRAVEH
jgi:hypothetical protein